jgi:hypothetical protein
VKYLPDENPPVLELSRRNLQVLLAKLDDPLSLRELESPRGPGEPYIRVKAVENEEHYADRAPGRVYMPSTDTTWT